MSVQKSLLYQNTGDWRLWRWDNNRWSLLSYNFLALSNSSSTNFCWTWEETIVLLYTSLIYLSWMLQRKSMILTWNAWKKRSMYKEMKGTRPWTRSRQRDNIEENIQEISVTNFRNCSNGDELYLQQSVLPAWTAEKEVVVGRDDSYHYYQHKGDKILLHIQLAFTCMFPITELALISKVTSEHTFHPTRYLYSKFFWFFFSPWRWLPSAFCSHLQENLHQFKKKCNMALNWKPTKSNVGVCIVRKDVKMLIFVRYKEIRMFISSNVFSPYIIVIHYIIIKLAKQQHNTNHQKNTPPLSWASVSAL